MKSGLWKHIGFIDVAATLASCSDTLCKREGYHGISKLREMTSGDAKVYPIVCLLCFNSPNVSLLNGLRNLSSKKLKGGKFSPNISNFATHVRRFGHTSLLDLLKRKSTGDPDSTTVTNENCSVGTNRTLSTTGIKSLSEWASMPKARIIQRLHELIYFLINDANVPPHIVQNSRLWDVIEFVASNSKALHGTERKSLEMGPYKYSSIQAVAFGTMMSTIERLVEDTRSFFRLFTQKAVPFIYIGHDIWDGKNKSVLGICLFFVSPLLQKMVMLPVGIVRSFGKKAKDVADLTMKALSRYVDHGWL